MYVMFQYPIYATAESAALLASGSDQPHVWVVAKKMYTGEYLNTTWHANEEGARRLLILLNQGVEIRIVKRCGQHTDPCSCDFFQILVGEEYLSAGTMDEVQKVKALIARR